MTERTTTYPATEAPGGDLGRRLAARRVRLGLTRRQTAARVGIADSYLRYLEEHSGAAPGTGVLIRLAEVLETTVAELTGGAVDLPPAPGRAARERHFTEMAPGECQALLGARGVGRVVVPTATGPVIVPVDYSVIDAAIVFRTALGATPSLASGRQVAFEVDRIDDAFSRGWSILVRGFARTVTDPRERQWLTEQAYNAPWAGGTRDVWVRVDPQRVTGRRLRV
ncbi:helix-turn-helix domain-containing protein [Streptomyces naphthomycinicus]|uniref:helix-turn-helix domain-containing protein n=1 Tax=Streptomyces naphthomycinicus TaxID=2872625 RepID=UPI001CEC03BF|nr:pyridoxamine 5'-phosphate oxidase family protein [Streptomyces sp. TML10]